MNTNKTVTITFGDQAENHVGMQKLGEKSEEGFNLGDLFLARDWFQQKGAEVQLFDLNYPLTQKNIYPDDEAYILIIRKGVDCILKPNNDATDFFNEQINLEWDSKALMYGQVRNKHARHNLCYGEQGQESDYQNGKGTIMSFDEVPLLKKIKDKLPSIIGSKGENLVAEGNYYYDINVCGIGYHGDSERLRVIGVRLGGTIPLVYQWFINGNPIGERISFQLSHGDIYIMSEKAAGNDWRRKTIYTLRHAAGAKKYIKIKTKK